MKHIIFMLLICIKILLCIPSSKLEKTTFLDFSSSINKQSYMNFESVYLGDQTEEVEDLRNDSSQNQNAEIIGDVLPYPSPMPWSSNNGYIGFRLTASATCKLKVFNMRGHLIKILHHEGTQGYNRLIFSKESFGDDLSTGVYTYLLFINSKIAKRGKVGVIR